jgi:hypothetical protein
MLAPSPQQQATVSFALPLLERKQEPGAGRTAWLSSRITLPSFVLKMKSRRSIHIDWSCVLLLGAAWQSSAKLLPSVSSSHLHVSSRR